MFKKTILSVLLMCSVFLAPLFATDLSQNMTIEATLEDGTKTELKTKLANSTDPQGPPFDIYLQLNPYGYAYSNGGNQPYVFGGTFGYSHKIINQEDLRISIGVKTGVQAALATDSREGGIYADKFIMIPLLVEARLHIKFFDLYAGMGNTFMRSRNNYSTNTGEQSYGWNCFSPSFQGGIAFNFKIKGAPQHALGFGFEYTYVFGTYTTKVGDVPQTSLKGSYSTNMFIRYRYSFDYHKPIKVLQVLED